METIGRYRVVRPLGVGGMGQVFVARDPDLDRDVALKLLHGEDKRGAKRALFLAEARSLAALRHPGIVTIYEIGEHRGQHFIAMEYLPGESLREVLGEGERLPALLGICQRVAEAVAAAHAQGILHRDIKPENIVVCDDGTVKVVDFGLARRLDGSGAIERVSDSAVQAVLASHATALVEVFTQTMVVDIATTQVTDTPGTQHTLFGTPSYMAPEVLMGQPSTAASDCYSLGVVIYECIAKRRPYSAPELHELISRILEGEPAVALDHRVAPLVMRMLDRDPENRPSLDEVADALLEFAPVRSSQSTPGLDRGEIVRKRRSLWIAALVTLCVLAGVGVAWRQLRPTAAEPTVVALEDIDARMESFANAGASVWELTDVLATLLQQIDGVRVVETDLKARRLVPGEGGPSPTPVSPGEWQRAAREGGAKHLVRGTLHESKRRLRARLEVLDLASGAIEVIERDARIEDSAALMVELANLVVHAIDPDGHALVTTPQLARTLCAAGQELYNQANWWGARPFLEQAVLADDRSYDCWSTLALVRAWLQTSPDLVDAAIQKAIATAPHGKTIRSQLAAGVLRYLQHDYTAAIEILEPLEKQVESEADGRDLHYFLGEAYWHDGQFDRGFKHLATVVPLNMPGRHTFLPATIHAGEYALVHRRKIDAQRYLSLQGLGELDAIEFAAGNYQVLADKEGSQFRLWSQLVLDKPPDLSLIAKLGPNDQPVFAAAIAIGQGDLAGAHTEITKVWENVGPDPVGGSFFALEELGEALLSYEPMRDDTAALLAFLREAARKAPINEPPRSLDRFAILAAPILGQAGPLPRRKLSTRMNKLADAIDAELAGDRERAAKLLGALVDDPSYFYDYPERVALIRNLHALGRTEEVGRRCGQVARPPVFRPAMLAARATCRSLLPKKKR